MKSSNCNLELQKQKKSYPRTCARCGYGPCDQKLVKEEALDKLYDNRLKAFRELLDAHRERHRVIEVILDYFPEYGDETGPLDETLKKIFNEKTK